MDFLSVWERVKEKTKMVKLTQLADFVGVSQQFVSKKKKENSFPIEWAFKIAQQYNLSTDWLLTGKTPDQIVNFKKSNDYNFQILKELDTWLTELVVKEPHRSDWFQGSLEDAFPMFKAWTKRKEDQEGQDPSFPEEKIA